MIKEEFVSLFLNGYDSGIKKKKNKQKTPGAKCLCANKPISVIMRAAHFASRYSYFI